MISSGVHRFKLIPSALLMAFSSYILNYSLINPSEHSIFLLIFRIIASLFLLLLIVFSRKSHFLLKISAYSWFFEAIFYINLEIPVYKLNKTLQLLSIFRFLSIFVLFSPKITSKSQENLSFLLLLALIINFSFKIGIENYLEILSLTFEIILFFFALFCFKRKKLEKHLKESLLLKTFSFFNEGVIILQKINSVYKIKLFNEKVLNLLDFNEISPMNFPVLNEKMHFFRFEKIKCTKEIGQSHGFLSKNQEKNMKDSLSFSNLSEILLFYEAKNRGNEAFHFLRLMKRETPLPFSSNLKLTIKKAFLYEKSFFFLFFRKIDSIEDLKEKNEIKTRLLSTFSHELKTPLNSSIPLLSEVLEKPDKIAYLRKALSCLKLLENSLNNILDYSLILSEQFLINLGGIELNELLTEVFSIIKEQIELKGLILDINLENSLEKVQIYTDYIRLRQILLNIFLNAIQFTYKGSISLRIVKVSSEPLSIEIRIRDTGIGISSEKLRLLQEKLLYNEEIPLNSTGSCLGLIIGNNIASLLGKYGLEIDSVENEGTTVRFFVVDQKNYEVFKAFDLKKQEILEENMMIMKKKQERNNMIYENSRIFDSMRKSNLEEESEKKLKKNDKFSNFAKTKRNSANPVIQINSNDFNRDSIQFTTRNIKKQEKKRSNSVILSSKRFSYEISKEILSFSSDSSKKSASFILSSETEEISLTDRIKIYDFEDKIHCKDKGFLINKKLGSFQHLELKKKLLRKDKGGGTLDHLNFESISQIETGKKTDIFTKSKFVTFSQNIKCLCEEILIVDDDPFNLFSLEIMLKSLNFTCKKASNGQEAIEVLKNFKKCHEKCKGIRLILMDYQMPVLDGVESTKEIKKMIKIGEINEIPVIGCTAFTAKNEVLKCLEAGMKDIFFKPLNRNVIQGIIKNWM